MDTGAPVGGSGGIVSTDFAQSITMSGCTGTFAGLVVDGSTIVSDGNPVWNLDIFQGDGFGGTLQYSQTGIVLTDVGGGHVFINIAGGSGSRAFTAGNQYTFRVSTASSTNSVVVFRNNTSFYGGGQGYLAGATFGTGGDILNVSVYTQAATSSCGAATRLYVKHNASGTNNGTSWTNAYTSLQSAIDYARGCSNIQEIWVSSGTYKPSKDKTGSTSPGNVAAKTFYINFPVALYGGFAGTETLLSQRNLASNVSTLSGDLDNNDSANPAVTAADVQGTNANIVLHIQDVAAGFTVDGFTITAAQFTTGFAGGGLHNEGTGFPFGCSATIHNCKIQGMPDPLYSIVATLAQILVERLFYCLKIPPSQGTAKIFMPLVSFLIQMEGRPLPRSIIVLSQTIPPPEPAIVGLTTKLRQVEMEKQPFPIVFSGTTALPAMVQQFMPTDPLQAE